MHARIHFVTRGLSVVVLAFSAHAQDFPPNDTTLRVEATGAFVDFTIPTEDPPAFLEIAVKGGDGGDVIVGGTEFGGRGIRVTTRIPVGAGPWRLAPSGTLRVIAASRGGTFPHPNPQNGSRGAGGGGGGSAVLYRPPGAATFVHLAVAGGGGGAFAEYPGGGFEGQDGQSTTCGGTLASWPGGCNGLGGNIDPSALFGGGGGGIYGPGDGVGGGAAGGTAGAEGGPTNTGWGTQGGWGCGPGGGAWRIVTEFSPGGGGGYSGGAAGFYPSAAAGAGGGGSWVDPLFTHDATFDFDAAWREGYVDITPVSAKSGASCSDPVLVPDVIALGQVFSGAADGWTQYGAPIPGAGCTVATVAFSEWYTYTNSTDCQQLIDVQLTSQDAPDGRIYGIEVFDECAGAVLQCASLGDVQQGGLSIDVPAHGERLVRVFAEEFGKAYTLSFTGSVSGVDSDGDGVPDACDVCSGDDTLDSDQDGIPDACDLCPDLAGSDCDGNGVQDACDISGFPKRLVLFNEPILPAGVTVSGLGGFVPSIVGEDLQIGGNAEIIATGSAVFDPVSPTKIDSFALSFYARIEPSSQVSNGLSVQIFDPDQEDPGGGEGGLEIGSTLTLSLTNLGGAGFKDVELQYGSVVMASANVPFQLDDGAWRQFHLEFANGTASVHVVEPGQPSFTAISGAQIPGFQPLRAHYGFSTVNLAGADPDVFIDEVLFEDRSGLYDRDIDQDGTLDSCQQPDLLFVTGAPANPVALAPVGLEIPRMGQIYVLGVDHSTYQPGSVSDVLLVSGGLFNVPLDPFGTLLASLPWLVTLVAVPGEPFSVPIPYASQLYGLPLTFQAGSLDPLEVGHEFTLTNALVAPIAGWNAGF